MITNDTFEFVVHKENFLSEMALQLSATGLAAGCA